MGPMSKFQSVLRVRHCSPLNYNIDVKGKETSIYKDNIIENSFSSHINIKLDDPNDYMDDTNEEGISSDHDGTDLGQREYEDSERAEHTGILCNITLPCCSPFCWGSVLDSSGMRVNSQNSLVVNSQKLLRHFRVLNEGFCSTVKKMLMYILLFFQLIQLNSFFHHRMSRQITGCKERIRSRERAWRVGLYGIARTSGRPDETHENTHVGLAQVERASFG